jgi:serine/threonine protein kinase
LIGAGAYGQVYAAIEEDNIETDVKKKLVAIKKISLKKESKVYYKRVLREIKILRNIKSQNIVRLKNIVLPESR